MAQEIRFKNLERFGYGPNVMKKTKVCTKCGQIAKTGTILCRTCGAFLPRETLYDRYKRRHTCCIWCGTVLTDDAKYCPQCGKKTKLAAAGE